MTNRFTKKDNIIGIVGAIAFFVVAYYDAKWSVFWMVAASAILLWTLASIFKMAGTQE